jgi:hypothetical protein
MPATLAGSRSACPRQNASASACVYVCVSFSLAAGGRSELAISSVVWRRVGLRENHARRLVDHVLELRLAVREERLVLELARVVDQRQAHLAEPLL